MLLTALGCTDGNIWWHGINLCHYLCLFLCFDCVCTVRLDEVCTWLTIFNQFALFLLDCLIFFFSHLRYTVKRPSIFTSVYISRFFIAHRNLGAVLLLKQSRCGRQPCVASLFRILSQKGRALELHLIAFLPGTSIITWRAGLSRSRYHTHTHTHLKLMNFLAYRAFIDDAVVKVIFHWLVFTLIIQIFS